MRDTPRRGTVHRGRLGPFAVVALAAALILTACSGDDDADTAGGSTTTSVSTTSSCPSTGGTADVRDDFPARTSSLVGRDVRAGTHDCYERFVVELQPSGGPVSAAFPGYWVRYATGPVTLQPKGEQVVIRGDAALLVSMGSPMRTTDGGGYQGPTDVTPNGDTVIREYRLVEDFEGQSTWAIGLDRERSFTVTVLDGPPRLVVDIAT